MESIIQNFSTIKPFYTTEYNNNLSRLSIVNHTYYDKCINDEESSELDFTAKITAILVPIFFGIIALTGFLGNSLVILVVALNSHMHSTTNLLIVNLACADLLFVIFCIPFTAFDYMVYKWPFGIEWCKIVQYLIVVTVLASIYTLVLMSIDRFLAIVYPVSSRSIRTEFNTRISIVLLWIIVFTISSPVIVLYQLEPYTACNNITWLSCTYAAEPYVNTKIYTTIFFCISYFVPLILISILYIIIITRIWARMGAHISAESQRGRKRVTRVVVILVLAFALLWCPIQIILLINGFKGKDEGFSAVLAILTVAAQTIAYTSSCINPILYAFLSENFRKSFQKAIAFTSSPKLYNSLSTSLAPIDKNAATRRKISTAQDSMAVI